jgi:hypothetical protein
MAPPIRRSIERASSMRMPCRLVLENLCLASLCLAIASPEVVAAAPPDKPVFRAGAATSNITPSIDAGSANRSGKAEATHVHDDLHARCLVLDDGEAKLAIVVCDLRHISAEVAANAKQIIRRTTGIPPECVVISATHTHTSGGAKLDEGDVAYFDYRAMLTRRIADGVLRAANQLEPARIGWGVAEEPTQVFNRRWFLTPKRGPIYGAHDNIEQVDTNPGYHGLLRPAGPVDPQITFLSVQSTSGKPISLLASYGLHYVGGIAPGAISADYFAMFADRVGELLGADRRQDPPFVGIMANGTSGDVNNLERYSEEELAKRGPQPTKRYAPYEKAREVANLCAAKVLEAHQKLTWHDHVKLSSVQRTLTFERRYPTKEEVEWAEAVKAKKIKPMSTSRYSTYSTVLAYNSPEMPPTLDVIVQTHRIGDLAVAAMPFEVFAEIGLELKHRSPIQPLMNISIANGSHGYLPTPEQHRLGGYETWIGVNQVQLDASVKMVKALVEMLGELDRRKP